MKHRFLSKRYWNSITTPMAEVVDLAYKYDDLINLSLGDPDYITDKSIIDEAFLDAHKGHTRYADSLGDPELRYEIANFYQKTYNHELSDREIMSVVGACHGMYLVLEAILDDGDEVIVPEPYFTPYYNQIQLVRGKPVILETYEKDHFQIDVEKLKSLITNRTKAIVVNTPNNPTGACLDQEHLQAIAKVAIEHDLIVIADEVYGGFSFQREFVPMATIEGMKERTITLGSFSKDYAMTGWRIGYVLAPSYMIDCIRDINEGICFCAPSISQRAAIYAIRMRESILKPMAEEYKKRVEYAYKRINEIPKISVLPPQGTFYLFVNIKETGLSSVEMSKKMLEEAHVLVIPGSAFGKSGEGYIRIACTVGVDRLKEAFDRIEKINL
ncbi:pyridoxal phosphate-dependent aminotransferase [Crassaminicella profunda]|uniref:pyridoxal phosphate-dependent aminotransferase n=1 Tax=Crassaminicella profunda TaxID=1286698 RepID=UPI001CA6394A|nr:pyridoxal phosphate-dependent aminotransferase [Crassaminicella profunda]QZY56213.1 pyridoxal phosphate-dependent aminotransferase [Crassaminicella profunda]